MMPVERHLCLADRPWAPQRHVPHQYIEQLRQLIEAELANHSPNRCDARVESLFVQWVCRFIVWVRLVDCLNIVLMPFRKHRTEFNDAKRHTESPKPLLRKEDLTMGGS